jgi:septal ring factor EnvC (AmiA/AmiB activator)
MAPDTAELIDDIDEHRRESQRLLEEADRRLRAAEELSRRLAREQKQSHEELAAAVATLRRAGLLPSR